MEKYNFCDAQMLCKLNRRPEYREFKQPTEQSR